MKLLKAGACALAVLACAPLGACAALSGQPVVSHQVAERALIDCDTAYIAIATIATSPALPADKRALAESIRQKAWDALQIARDLYAANQSPNIAGLAALLVQAQSLIGAH